MILYNECNDYFACLTNLILSNSEVLKLLNFNNLSIELF